MPIIQGADHFSKNNDNHIQKQSKDNQNPKYSDSTPATHTKKEKRKKERKAG